MKLSTDQQNAADVFMAFITDPNEKIMILDGYSGSGKSFLTKHLIELAKKSSQLLKLISATTDDLEIHCTATTNQAANVLSLITGREATTIHALLGLKVVNNFRTGKSSLQKTGQFQELHNCIVFIDEASMIDDMLLELILASTYQCKIVIIGDSYQILPIFSDTCPAFDLKVKYRATLKTIMRQGLNSPIAKLGEKFREAVDTGVFPKIKVHGSVIQRVDELGFKNAIDTKYLDVNHKANSAKVIVWTNPKVRMYNKYIRKLFTPNEEFTVGETVMTNKPILLGNGTISTNSFIEVTAIRPLEISNGIEGWPIELEGKYLTFQPRNQDDVTTQLKKLAQAKAWQDYFFVKEFFADLRPIHSSTTHKAQGSTYNTAFIDLVDIGKNHSANEVARLLYVGITRASTTLILFGDLPYKYGGN